MQGVMSRLLPRIISAKTHGMIDYAAAGTSLIAGMLFRRNCKQRASNAALVLGAGILANALLTDYPLGVFRQYSFRVHGAFDYGIAALSQSMPRLLGIENEPEARYFKWQATGHGLIAAMSDYGDSGLSRSSRVRFRKTA
jgi:hypothetical protein